MRYLYQSIGLALSNIRANPLHTFLSTLGIIIGVAALVGILALGDGLEQAGREQISGTTSIQSFKINSKSRKNIGGVSVPLQVRPKISFAQAREIQQKYKDIAIVDFVSSRTVEATERDSTFGIYLHGSTEQGLQLMASADKLEGRYFDALDIDNFRRVMLISTTLANEFGYFTTPAFERTIYIGDEPFEVIGVMEIPLSGPRAVIPISVFLEMGDANPTLAIKADNVENIPQLKEEMAAWLDTNFEEGSEAFDLISDDFRIEQLSEGILLFKLIMGAITGISVLVGGIGVMNVLLISVTERTKEIGIRKATGAQKKDIVFQFLAESITISLVGAVIGWLVGMAGVFAFVPLVNKIVNVPFGVVINPISVVIVLAIAIVIGISFGTYPAWRAAQLDPIDAIRHE
jgi:putative ABC transport system permease protein